MGYDTSEAMQYTVSQLNFPSISFVPRLVGVAYSGSNDAIERSDVISEFQLDK